MFDLFTFTGITIRKLTMSDIEVFDLNFECEIIGILNIVVTIADDEEVLNNFNNLITNTYDGRPFADHVVDAVLNQKPSLSVDQL